MGRLKAAKLVFLSSSFNKEINIYKKLTSKVQTFTLLNQVLKLKTQTFIETFSILIALIIAFVSITYFKIYFDIVILYLLICIRLIPVIKNLAVNYQSIRANIGAMEIVQKFFSEVEDHLIIYQNNKFFNHKLEKINKLQLKNVNYNYYISKTNAINNINLIIHRPSLNVISGPSGSGKSTVLDILSTFRIPSSGNYYINDELYNNEMQKQIISQISYLPQETVFFENNLHDHITYNSNEFDKDLFDLSIELSGVTEFFDKNLDFKMINLYENASNLSGGQKQRIDLARIIYENRSIIILDEPTNKLDYVQESKFIENLKKLIETTKSIAILITHKIELASTADQVIILDKGNIIASGKHEDLCIKNQWYKNNFIAK